MIPLLLTIACAPEPAVPVLVTPPRVEVAGAWQVKVDALLPTDVVPTDGGGFVVLDSYADTLRPFGPDHAPGTPWELPPGDPVRLAPAPGGGVWVTDAGGRVLTVDAAGSVAGTAHLDTAGFGPPAAIAAADTVLVSDRDGRVGLVDPASGALRVAAQPEGTRIGFVAGASRATGAGWWAADELEAQILHLGSDGVVTASFGRYGEWAGHLRKPVSVTEGPRGSLLVADAALGVVQLFSTEGVPLGILATGGEPIRFEHPVTVRPAGSGWLVLDAGAATVWGFTIDEVSLGTAIAGAGARWAREPLARDSAAPGIDATTCRVCHDGLFVDGREVWDPALAHHPVGEVPERPLPAALPLDADGKLACTTCHSPHGAVSLEEATSTGPGSQGMLIRHQSADNPFTRLTRTDSSLCLACHGDAAHERALELVGGKGGSHPTGAALTRALAARGGQGVAGLPGGVTGACLDCHSVHGAAEGGLTRDAEDGRTCLACHEGHLGEGGGHPIGGRDEPTCADCHSLTGGRGGALLAEGGDRLCAGCHDDVRLGTEAHANVGGAGGVTCLGCHTVHEGERASHLLRLGSATAGDPDGCLRCHARGSGSAPGRLGHPVDGQVHGGKDALVCASCHQAHLPTAAVDCASCHAEQARVAHGHGSATCLDCHPAHDAPPRATVAGVNPAGQRCLGCHAASTAKAGTPVVTDFDHPAPVFAPDGTRWTPLAGLPLYGRDGEPVPPGQNGDLTCESCHLVHGPDAAHPGDHLVRPDWKPACAACHGEDALPYFRYFHDRARLDRVEAPR